MYLRGVNDSRPSRATERISSLKVVRNARPGNAFAHRAAPETQGARPRSGGPPGLPVRFGYSSTATFLDRTSPVPAPESRTR